MTAIELLRMIAADPMPMQWRGSDDAVTWTEWRTLARVEQKVDPFVFYQARILIDGHWKTSSIGCDP